MKYWLIYIHSLINLDFDGWNSDDYVSSEKQVIPYSLLLIMHRLKEFLGFSISQEMASNKRVDDNWLSLNCFSRLQMSVLKLNSVWWGREVKKRKFGTGKTYIESGFQVLKKSDGPSILLCTYAFLLLGIQASLAPACPEKATGSRKNHRTVFWGAASATKILDITVYVL